MSIVLDLSQYDLPTLDAECMAANGVTGAILGVFTPLGPEPMAEAASRLIDAGIAVHGFYGLIYFGSPFGATRDTLWAIELAQRFGVSRVWLDCEIDGKAIGFNDAVEPTREQRVAEIREAVRLVESAGLQAGIYSGAWWWPGATGNSTEFARLPLWHAAYFNDGTRVRDVNYGGWSQCAIHQWTSTLEVCGRNRDANHVWDSEVLGGDDMSEADRRRLDRLEKLLAGNGIAKDLSKPDELTFGEDALAYAAERGWSAFLGLGLNQTRAGEAHTRIDNHTHGTTPAPEEPRVRTIRGTFVGEVDGD